MGTRQVSIRRGLALAGRKPRRQYPEQALHRAVASFLDLAAPRGGEVWWTTFPLGGGGGVRGAQMKGLGTRAGTPDLLVIWRGHSHWIELKAEKGRVSDEQANCHLHLRCAGCAPTRVAYSVGEVEAYLLEWAVPLRARLKP